MARLHKLLEADERLLWLRGGDPSGPILAAVQILGHTFLTAVSVLVGAYVPLERHLQVVAGVMFWISSNTPLIIWAVRKRRTRARASKDVLFVTDRRLGVIRAAGGVSQLPVTSELAIKVSPGAIQFLMPEQFPIVFEGLTGRQVQLVAALVANLQGRPQQGSTSAP